MDRRNVAPGLLLIGLGALLYLVQAAVIGGETLLPLIGAALLGAYALTRQYAFLVPGSIMTGLGIGILWDAQTAYQGGAVLVGLGLGFGMVCVVDLIMKHTRAPWWPLIPAGILTIIGVLIEAGREGYLADFTWLGPIVLVMIGIVVLIIQGTGRGSHSVDGAGDVSKV
jgi:hypothetical protein